MANIDLVDKKEKILICGLACVLLMTQSFSVVYAAQPQLPDDFKVREYFSFFGSGGIDWRALNDPNNNPILVACIKGIADESLKLPGILDVQKRLERLERGNLIRKVDGHYTLAFPAIVGDKRDRLQKYAEQAARQLIPSTEKMIAQLQPHLAGRDEMLYHVLWSVIMDGGPAWDAARAEMNKKIDAGDTSTENKAWLLYPSHPFQAGTNSWSNSFGHLKVTWSRNTPSPNDIGRVIARYATQLTQAVEQNRAVESADAKDALGKYGLVDEAGKVRFYVMQPDSGATRFYAELGGQFGRQMMTQLDVKKVADMLDVSPGVAFVIAYHEICWQLLQDLSDKKVLSVPQIVAQAGTKISDVYQLVSLILMRSVKDPLLDTEMSAEEKQAIEEYRRIKTRILAGESYQDSSTPLHAVLTHLSALGQGQTRDYFMGSNILRAPAPPAEPEEGSLWPVFAGDTELADTFILVYSKGQWIWIGNMGSNYDWHVAKSTFEKWAREKIEQSVPAEEQTRSESDKSQVSQRENEIPEYFEKTKNEILEGRKFSNQSTPANALLTLISAYHRQDKNTLEQIFPIVKQKQFEKLSSPEVRAQMLAAARTSILCRIEIEDKQPEESDLCAIYTRESPEKPIDQVWSFAYIEGAWRFAGSTSSMDNWRTQAEQAEAMTRNILRSEAEKAKESTIDTLQQETEGRDGSEQVQSAPKPDEPTINRVLSLGGRTGCMRVADSQLLHSFSNAITIEVWLKASSYAEYGDINSIIRKNVASGAENFLLRFRNIDGSLCVQMGLGEIGTLRADYEFTVEKWYHLAGTYDGSDVTLLVNGITVESGKFSGILHIDESDLFVGKGDPEFLSGEYFHGALDEIRIWNIARSQEQIQAAINSPLTGREEGLIGYWNFDDGTAKDLSGHGNDGILDGDAQIVESPFPVSLAHEEGKLVAWWKFENDVNDAAGDNHGTVHGNPIYVDGKFGRAISFDGNDYVDCGNPDSLNFSTGDWTISAWIKTTQSGIEETDKGTVFANGADGGGGIRYTLAVNEGQSDSITLTTDSDIHKAQAIGKTAVNDGAWHHIVGMRNSGQLHLYVDGVLDGGNYLPAEYDLSATSRQNVYIGAITSNDDNSLYKYFVGIIDEICIFSGAIDVNGVRTLYSGEDPLKVARTSIISRPIPAERKTRTPMVTSAEGGIEGDWRMVSDQISQQVIIEIRKKAGGTLSGAIVAEVPDEASQAILLDGITFENGRLYFEAPTRQTVFDGKMKEDGLIIEGRFQQQGQMITVVLKRVVAAPSEIATIAQEQLQGQTSRTSNIATALILILALAGLVGGIVFFLVKSSIRK